LGCGARSAVTSESVHTHTPSRHVCLPAHCFTRPPFQLLDMGERLIKAGYMYADDTPVEAMREVRTCPRWCNWAVMHGCAQSLGAGAAEWQRAGLGWDVAFVHCCDLD
jgi:hypothetical protein